MNEFGIVEPNHGCRKAVRRFGRNRGQLNGIASSRIYVRFEHQGHGRLLFGNGEVTVESGDSGNFGGLLGWKNHDFIAEFDFATKNGSRYATEVVGTVHHLHGHAWGVDALLFGRPILKVFEQRRAFIPAHKFTAERDVVASERAHRDECKVFNAEFLKRGRQLGHELVIHALVVTHRVKLVDDDCNARHTHDVANV